MNKVQYAFDKAGEFLEHLFSIWWGIVGYVLLGPLSFYAWGWDGIDRYIYVTGAIIILLGIGQARRSSKAIHAKLDALTPDDKLNRLEEKAEQEIEEARNG